MQRLLESRKDSQYGDWDVQTLRAKTASVLHSVVQSIGCEWSPSPTHVAFLKRLATHAGRRHCDIFTLNYDVVLEASLESERLPYTDGFRGAENAFFDPSCYESSLDEQVFFRIYKLHGSVSWCRDDEGVVRRRPGSCIEEDARLVIYPSEQKYYETRYGVYETLLARFRDMLRRDDRPNNKLVVLGYSFSDDHVTEAIVDAITRPGSKLTVYALVGADGDLPEQQRRFEDMVDRCEHRFSVMVGSESFHGEALEQPEWEEIRTKDLWKFENLVEYMCGGV